VVAAALEHTAHTVREGFFVFGDEDIHHRRNY
jgi:hypothetical protein